MGDIGAREVRYEVLPAPAPARREEAPAPRPAQHPADREPIAVPAESARR